MSSTRTDVDISTILQINNSVKCEFGPETFEVTDPQCPHTAKWIVFFRRVCAHGSPLVPPYQVFLCLMHKDYLLALFAQPGTRCAACLCRMDQASHVTERISPL